MACYENASTIITYKVLIWFSFFYPHFRVPVWTCFKLFHKEIFYFFVRNFVFFWKLWWRKNFLNTFLALMCAMSSMMSNWRLCVLPLLLGGPETPEAPESRRLLSILALLEGKAAIDSRRLRPNSVSGTFDIVTTECLRPPGWGPGACDKVAKNVACFGDGPEPSPPLSLNRRTWSTFQY